MSLAQIDTVRRRNGRVIYTHAEKVARGWVKAPADRGYTTPTIARRIIDQTASDYGMSVSTLLRPAIGKTGPGWVSRRVFARFDLMNRLRTCDSIRQFSTPHIAVLIGLTDHTTVINGLRRWQELSHMADQVKSTRAAKVYIWPPVAMQEAAE